jgi:hypothetical protein
MAESTEPLSFGYKCVQLIAEAKQKKTQTGSVLMMSEVAQIIDQQDRARQGACLPDSDGLTPAERIYAAYPRKVGRKTALRAITAALRGMPSSELLAKVQAYKQATDTWPANERQFIPYPSTWFNRGSYADDPKEWERGQPQEPSARPQQSASLGSLQLQLKRIEDEMEGILYPGGAAFKTIPTGDKLARVEELQRQRAAIKLRIDSFGQ